STLLEQTLPLQVAASPAAPFTAPSANLTAPAGALTFQAGRGLLLLENLSHADALTALASGSEATALRLRLQTLGYSGEPDASFGSGLLSLADLGLIPAPGATDGGGMALEGIRVLGGGAEPVVLRRTSVTLGSGGSRRLINAWELRPGLDHQGPLALSLDYGDGRRQDSASLGLLVTNVPDAPRRVPGQEEHLRLSLETGPCGADDLTVINLRNLAVDPDGTSLSFSLAAGGKPPAGVSFDAAAAELRLGSLPFEAVGRHTFTLLASDGDAATAVPLNFEITIRERNLAPLWNLPQSLLSSQAPATGWDLISQRWVLEANGDPLRFSLSSGDARPLPAGIRLDGSRLVVDPATPAGTSVLRLGASDGPERLLVQALTSLVVPAAAVAVPPTLRLEGSLRQAEGTAFGLQLRLDRPAAEELTLRWTLNPRRDSAEPLLPSRTGLVRIAAGGEGALLSLPSREDGLLLGDQDLELVLESLSGAVQLPPAPTPLMLLDNDSAPQLLTSRWLNDRELELLYQPGAAGSAGTGLVVSLSDPAAAGLFDGASLSQVFLSGWLGERRENGSLELRWSDPLAAAWPGSAAVSLARLRLDRTAATSSPAIRVEASAGEQQLVRWINSPWQAPLRLPFLEELRARLGGDARGLLVEPGLAAALAADAYGGLLILDARALLERRYSPDPTLTVRRQGQTIQLDLGELIPAEAGVLRFSDGQWGLLPAAARDGSPQHQASQALLLRSGDGGGELSDLSLGGVSAAARTAIQHLSGGADPLFGELAFHIRGLTPGALSSVEITLPQSGVTSPLLLKQDAAGAWLPFAFDPITGTGAMFHDDDGNGSADRVVLWSRDGGRGDRDGLANGVIVDPVVFAGAIPPPTLSIAAALADRAEGTGGSTAFSFSVYRDGDTSGTSSAQWTVQGSGAKPAAADDFAGGVFSSGTVVFATGEATRTITVPVAADSSVEADEAFRVSLSEASGAV
ncbi:MAG: choice-of-anchor U domain-containing protein, partial [Synechococcaceae cyanobacterium]